MSIDHLFISAIVSFGLGLSLLVYRLFARRYNWPVGTLHTEAPLVPVAVGLFSLITGLSFAVARGAPAGGLIIVVCGLLLAVFWTGFLRVGSQVSLFLAPIAALIVIFGNLALPIGY